jgi:hypothetical protein
MTKKDLILFTRFGMGDAPADLQQKLAGVFLMVLSQDTLPGAIAFYGDGVKLTCPGSVALARQQRGDIDSLPDMP